MESIGLGWGGFWARLRYVVAQLLSEVVTPGRIARRLVASAGAAVLAGAVALVGIGPVAAASVHARASTPADADQLATETLNGGTPRTFTYDDNGALTNDGAGRSFSHDVLGRLTAVDGPVDATYAYDGAGRRISATVDAVTTDFLLDIRGLGSVLSDGTRRFLPGAPNAGYESDGAWVNALTDQQGTVMGHADAVGLVGNLTHYDPYGAPMPGESGLGSGPGFTGEWSDATGLLDLRARAYDPSLHSFMVRDSFGGVASAPLSANRYAYALGNPLRYTDPSGHFVNEFLRNPGLWFSAGLQFIPVVGDAYSLATGLIGFDPIAGFELSGTDRALAMAGGLALGGGFHLLGHVDDIARAENRVDALGDVGSGVGRSADDLGDFTRSGDNLGPSLRSGDGAGGAGRGADSWSPSGGGGGMRSAEAPAPARGADDAMPTPASCRTNSFLPATLVLMADGSTKPIEGIEVGDLVLAADPRTGEEGAREVTEVIVGTGTKQLVELTIDGDTITATDGHPFWVVADEEWVNAEDLEPGDRLRLDNGSTVAIDVVRDYSAEAVVYNLTVGDLHTYFVAIGGDGVLAHNCGGADAAQAADDLPIQRHHFATNKSSVYTPRMRTIADRYGLGLNEPWNTAMLPHLGRHPNAYHDFVLRGMGRAANEAGTDAARFTRLFDTYVRQPVIQNPDLLRLIGWE